MVVTVKEFSEMIGKDVFTTKGVYCGKATDIEVDLDKFRMKSVIVDVARGSFLANLVGNKKGVVIPFQMVDNIGDVVIIKHITPMSMPDVEEPSMPMKK